jgi:hypothetical protein
MRSVVLCCVEGNTLTSEGASNSRLQKTEYVVRRLIIGSGPHRLFGQANQGGCV